MGSRKLMIQWLSLLMSIAFSPIVSSARAAEPKLADQIREAERILVVVPEKDVDVAAGEEFLVEIKRVLRGSGQKGSLARIVQSGDDKSHPKFEAGKQYVFLLKNRAQGKGWIYLGTNVLPVTKGKVANVVDGEAQEELSLDDLQELIGKNSPPRTSMEGRWMVVFTQQGGDFFVWLVDVAKAKGADDYQVRLVATSKLMEASTLKSFAVKGNEINLVFDGDGTQFDFQGQFENGAVLGGLSVEKRMVVPARLEASEAANMKAYDQPKSALGRDEFVKALEPEEHFASVQEFVSKNPNSPLVMDAYRELIGLAKKEGLDETKFNELADSYVKAAHRWGQRFEIKSHVDIGVNLARSDYLPEVGLKHLDLAEKMFDDNTPLAWKLATQIQKATVLMSMDKLDEGIAILQKLHEEFPFEAEITYTLAQNAEKADKVDDALDLYAEITALPMLEQMLFQVLSRGGQKVDKDQLPSARLHQLWKKKHGSLDGLEERIDEIYEQKVHAISHDKVEPRAAGGGTRTVLCELFTGAECPPCVGADLGTTAIESTYPQTEVIVLRYHEHIPQPDPLANSETEERFKIYQGGGTPSIFLNGQPYARAGGFLADSERVYKDLRELIDPILKEKTPLKIDLSAKAANGKVTVAATASGMDNFPDDIRLVLALTEDKIAFRAGNGIRFHEMIVRVMPAGAKGVGPKDGKLKFTREMDMVKLKKLLKDYLSKFETEFAMEFPEKPLAMKKLHVVAFLQNAKTLEVLQAVSTPVGGTLPAEEEKEDPKPAKKPEKKEKDDSEKKASE